MPTETMTKGRTWCQRDAEIIIKSFGCPLVLPGSKTRMTRQGFKSACLKVQLKQVRGWYDDGKLSNHRRGGRSCKTGLKVKDGKPFRAPEGVEFLSLQELKIKSGKYG